jgi:hypothetical protein
MGVSVVGLFCEDIREEKFGSDILIGIMPDNLVVPAVPSALPKLGFYVRANIPVNTAIKSISVKVKLIDGNEMELGRFDESMIEKDREGAIKKGAPILGLIFRAMVAPAHIPKYGRILILAKIDDDEFVCGSLNVQGPE